MTFALCLNFQFFFSVGESFESHPLAPRLLLEVVLAGLIVWSTLIILLRIARHQLRALDVLFYLTPFIFIGVSAASAYVQFGQPLILGIGEDRRAFSFLFWFLLEPIYRRGRLTLDDLLNCMIACGSIYLVCGLFVQAAFEQRMLAREIPDFDPRKLRISSAGECFGFCIVIGFARLVSGYRLQGFCAAAVGLLGLALVAQTRQVVIAAALASTIAILWARPLPSLCFGLAGLIMVTAFTLLDLDAGLGLLVQSMLPNIEEFGEGQFEYNTRAQTGGVILEALWRNGYLGLGALSKQFDMGLQVYYGRNFYINDVGILGEVYRLGAVALMLFAVWAVTEASLWRRVQRAEDRVLAGGLLLTTLAMFWAGWLFRYGFVHTFLVLVMLAAQASPRRWSFAGLRATRAAFHRARIVPGRVPEPADGAVIRTASASASPMPRRG